MAKKGKGSLSSAMAQAEANKKLLDQAEASLANLLKGYQQIGEKIANINFLSEQNNKLKEEENELIAKNVKLEADRLKATTKAEKKRISNEIKNNKAAIDAKSLGRKENKKIIKQLEEQAKKEKEILDSASKTNLAKNTAVSIGKKLIAVGKKNLSYYYKQSKSVKEAQLSMGILSKQSLSFSNTLSRAAINTNVLGSNISDLAEMQAEFSSQLGLSVSLTEKGFMAMSKLAKGTGLGNNEAAGLAASMNTFNINTESSAKIVEDVLTDSRKLGVNGLKVTKNVAKNLKIANKYGFKNGIKGMAKLTAEAERLGVELDSIAGIAEQLFTPEGAIDMASKLQVLGGAWSNIADPFTLMYQARNDMDGLTKSIAEASKGSFQFNAQTGEFEASALEMHRLREVAKATGMEYNELAEMSKRAAKLSMVDSKLGMSLDPEYKDYITSIAQFDGNKKEFYINIDGKKKFLNELTKDNKLLGEQIKALKQTAVNLEENAKAAQTFDETWNNFKNTLKTLLMPIFEGFQMGFTNAVQGLVSSKGFKAFAEGAHSMGEAIGRFGATTMGLTTVLAGWGALKALTWIANGKFLAMGFNSKVSLGGSGGSGGSGGYGGSGSKSSKSSKASKVSKASKASKASKSSKGIGKFGKFGKLGKGLGKAAKVGGVLSVLGTVFDLGSNLMDEDLEMGDALLKTLDENKFTALGALLAPLTGGLSLVAGGALDALVGASGSYGGAGYDSFAYGGFTGSGVGGADSTGFKRAGIVHENEYVVPKNVLQSNVAGPLVMALEAIRTGVPLKNSSSNSSSVGSSKIEFGEININFGTIKIEGDYGANEIDLANDPMFLRELTGNIQDGLRKNMVGKSNPNPIT